MSGLRSRSPGRAGGIRASAAPTPHPEGRSDTRRPPADKSDGAPPSTWPSAITVNPHTVIYVTATHATFGSGSQSGTGRLAEGGADAAVSDLGNAAGDVGLARLILLGGQPEMRTHRLGGSAASGIVDCRGTGERNDGTHTRRGHPRGPGIEAQIDSPPGIFQGGCRLGRSRSGATLLSASNRTGCCCDRDPSPRIAFSSW